MQSQIFHADELSSSMPLRRDLTETTRWLQALLDDPEIGNVRPFREHGLHMISGPAVICGKNVTLIFEHKGSSNDHRISALRIDGSLPLDAVRHLRFVIRRNSSRLQPPLRVHAAPFTGQPEVLGLRQRTGSASGKAGTGTSTPYRDTPGYAGERHVVKALRQHFPELDIDWVNEESESGLPYDVLIGGRLAIDVKATRVDRSYANLSEAESAFRARHLAHHMIALVTLKDDLQEVPHAVDLYHGPQLRRLPLAALPGLLGDLPLLEETGGAAPEAAGRAQDSTTFSPLYFRPGRYESAGAEHPWNFSADGQCQHGGEAGTYRLSGHDILIHFTHAGLPARVLRLASDLSGWTLTGEGGAVWTQARDEGGSGAHPGADVPADGQ